MGLIINPASGQPFMEVGIGADLSQFEKQAALLEQEVKGLGGAVSQAGQASTSGYNTAMDQAGKKTSALTGFIKSHRSEMRQQSFLFKQGQHEIMALGFAYASLSQATNNDSAASQHHSQMMMQGFTTFQAVSFSLSAFAGTSMAVSSAVAGVVAGAFLLYQFLDRTKERADLAEKAVKGLQGSFAGLSQQSMKGIQANAKDNLKEMEEMLKVLNAVKAVQNSTLGGKVVSLFQGDSQAEASLKNSIAFQKLYVKSLDENIKNEAELGVEQAKNLQTLTDENAVVKVKGSIIATYLPQELAYNRELALFNSGASDKSKKEIEAMKEKLDLTKQDLVQERMLKDIREAATKPIISGTAAKIEAMFPELVMVGKLQKAYRDLADDEKLSLDSRASLASSRAALYGTSAASERQAGIVPSSAMQPVTITKGPSALDDLKTVKKEKDEEKAIWEETHQFEMSLLSGLTAGVRQTFVEILGVHREAKDAWDAVWITMENTVIDSLANMAAKWVENEIVSEAANAMAIASATATGAAIAASYATAAALASIATFGGAAVAGGAAAMAAIAMVNAAALVPHLAQGGMAYSPMLAVIGDNPGASYDPEIVSPLSKLGNFAKEQKVRVYGVLRGRDIYLTGDRYQTSMQRLS